jgi:two-component system response regulator YesN
MFKVLLVDDEELDLEGLNRFIPWSEMDMEVIGAVNSGFTALDVFERENVDVLVTDIKMPNMSGLELARRGLEKMPRLKTVFVSGYADFHYAKQALSLHASNYVLKPVDNREINEVLRKVAVELREERERSDRESGLHETVPYLKNDLMFRWLEGKAESKKIAALMERYGLASIHYPAAVAVIEIDDLAWRLNSFREDQRTCMIEELFGTLLQLFQAHGIEHYCTIENHRIGLIINGTDPAELLEHWIQKIRSCSPLTITIGLGESATCPDAVPLSYHEAKEALSGKLFYGKNRLIRGFDKRPEIIRNTKDLNDILETMFSAMSRYDLIGIDDCISDLFELVKRLDGKFSIYHFLLHAIAELNDQLHSVNEDFYKLIDLEVQNLELIYHFETELIYHFETLGDIQSWLRRKVFTISERLQCKKKKKNHKLIEEIKGYIDERLGQDLNLRQAAEFVSFSPNYLGHLFKEEVGTNFSDYVIAKRLERARKLLQNPKMKIFEVAYSVGYKNLTYFSRHFKEVYGITPGEYRRQS